MKQHLFLIIFLFFRTFLVFSQNVDSVFIEKMVLQESEIFSKKAAFVENFDYNSYDLIYQKMVWEIDPAFRYIKGEITSKIKSASDSLVLITFDLSDSLNVDSVVYNKNLLEYTHSNNKLKITFSDTLRMNETDSFSVVYSGIPASSGYGTFVQTTHNNVPVIWTLSEPYGAKDWWPCKESLSDKIDSIDIIVTCPEQYRTASNGIVVADTIINGFRTMHWKHRYPIATYLVAIAITNYSVYSDFVDLSENRKLEILNYVFPENLYNAKQNTGVTVDFIKLYNQLIGEYPFSSEKYGHAQFGWGGGMEHQTMSFMTNFGFNIVAHELAHQWFGDYITTGNWHDIWLNEGFATYFNGLVYENIRPENEWLTWKRNNVAQIISSSDGSVYVEHTTNINRIFNYRLSYAKGAHLLHMLRWIMGDDNFFTAIRNYFNDPEIANGFAQNYQLVQHLENVADTSFTEFFNDWYYGEGYPVYQVNYSNDGDGIARIRLSQTTSHSSVGFFEMPVPVRVYNFNHTDSVDFRLNNTQNNQEFTVFPGFEISDLVVDPDYWLVSKTALIVQNSEIDFPQDIQIYPNPFSENIWISVPQSYSPFQLEIYSLKGELLQVFNENQSDIKPDVSPGMYVLKITTPKGVYAQKLVKQ